MQHAITSHPFIAGTVTAGTLALKTFDALAASPKGLAMIKWLAQAPPGSLAASAGMRALGQLAGTPRKLQPVSRAGGGDVDAGQAMRVGENGPELLVADKPTKIVPLGGNAGNPFGGAPPTTSTTIPGLGQGQGLSDQDIQRARRGFVVIMGPNGPVAVPQ